MYRTSGESSTSGPRNTYSIAQIEGDVELRDVWVDVEMTAGNESGLLIGDLSGDLTLRNVLVTGMFTSSSPASSLIGNTGIFIPPPAGRTLTLTLDHVIVLAQLVGGTTCQVGRRRPERASLPVTVVVATGSDAAVTAPADSWVGCIPHDVRTLTRAQVTDAATFAGWPSPPFQFGAGAPTLEPW